MGAVALFALLGLFFTRNLPAASTAVVEPAPGSRRRASHWRADLATRGRLHSARWICTSSGHSRRRPSGRRSMRCSGRPSPAGSAGRGMPGPMAMPPAAATRRGPGARSCCRRSTRSSRGSAGSASRPSTTSAGGWRSPRPRHTAWPRSTRSSPRRRGRRSWPTSVTTSPVGWPARNGSATTWRAAWRRPASRSDDGRAAWLRSPCLGLCDRHRRRWSPVAGEPHDTSVIAPVDAVGDRCPDRAGRPGSGRSAGAAARRPAGPRFACCAGSASSTRCRSTTIGRIDGYAALARALEIGPEAVIDEVTASKLMGRGGAAFPTGRKWAAVAAQPAQPHYLVCNADESEPGTFKDRVLLEGDPFATVEAMTIAAFATGASQGYLYIRGEYPDAEARVANAIVRPARRGCSGRHPRLGLRLRHRAATRRRRLHLRRGDGAVRVDRGQARRAAQQAAVPGRGRAVRQADRGQQRRDPGQRAAHRARRRRGLRRGSGPRARPGRSCSACPATSPGRASTRSSSAPRWATSSSWPVACRAVAPSGRSCSVGRPGSSSGPRRSTCRSRSRRRAPPGPRSARA